MRLAVLKIGFQGGPMLARMVLFMVMLDRGVDAVGAELVILVTGIEKAEGTVHVALADSEENFLKTNFLELSRSVEEAKPLAIHITETLPETFVVSVFHDEDDDGDLDTGLFGRPLEPYGFSNDARGLFGPPKFEDCLVVVAEVEGPIEIELK